MSRPQAPPVKSQGIKTRLVPFIRGAINWDGRGRWVEPFFGSGAVALNLAPERALLADTNPHLVRLYRDIQQGRVTPAGVAAFLTGEGARLRARGGTHYYDVRARFNAGPTSLDFLFLNRAAFNGLIRFNRAGGFNTPFCRKPDRFRPAYVTRIANQVGWAARLIAGRDYAFKVQDWRATLAEVGAGDFVYLDPPYAGRHADYHNRWDEAEADALAAAVTALPGGFALSSWLRNRHRENGRIAHWFAGYPMRAQGHFYHVGPSQARRGAAR